MFRFEMGFYQRPWLLNAKPSHLGKHSQSKNTYERFCTEYKLLYGDEFEKSFNEVLSE